MRLSYYWLPILEAADEAIARPESSHDSLIETTKTMVDQAKAQSLAAGFSKEQIDAAQFAIIAAIDEKAISSAWQGANDWVRQPLQMVYFSTTRAGWDFFQKASDLSPSDVEVKEVYALVLLNGFTGYYSSPDDEQLQTYRQTLFDQLTQQRQVVGLGQATSLFPDAIDLSETTDKQSKKYVKSTQMLLLVIFLPLMLLAGVYTFFRYDVSGLAEQKITMSSPKKASDVRP